MRVIQGINNVDSILKMYKAVISGSEFKVRGADIRNVHNLAVVLNPALPIITDFAPRKMNLAYAKREWLWYLGADPKDDSICQHATAWAKLKQEDGTFYSNYGQYLFGEQHLGKPTQFEYIIRTLRDDIHSRRASMTLLKQEHLFADNTDVVCTYAINFFVEGKHLNMTVMMRSNDVIWGFTNDAFCFWQLYLFVYQILLTHVPDLQMGSYTHLANSMHVYDRHYMMIYEILANPYCKPHVVPMPTAREALGLVLNRGEGDVDAGPYTRWLKTFD